MKNSQVLAILLICIHTPTQAFKDPAIESKIMTLNKEIFEVIDLEEHSDLVPSPKKDGKYTKRYGALCKLQEGAFVFGAFATLDGFDESGAKAKVGETPPQQFLCLGFGQKTNDKKAAELAMKNYLAHPDAFGIVVSLPAFFSGKEEEAMKYFSETEVQNKIKTQIVKNDDKPTGDLFIDATWSIPVGDPNVVDLSDIKRTYVAILKITKDSIEDTFRFCVVVTTDNEQKFVIGTSHVNNTKAILTFVDYVQKAHMTDMMVPPEAPIDLSDNLYALSYCFDFVFRKLAEKTRGDVDLTPAANKALASASFLLSMEGQIEFNTLITLLLKDVPLESATTIDEIKRHFGNEIGDLLNSKRTGIARVSELQDWQTKYFKTFEDTTTSTGLQEQSSLITLLEKRYKVVNKKDIGLKLVTFVSDYGFIIEKTAFAIFSVEFNTEDESKFANFLMQGQVNGSIISDVVVGELLKSTPENIKQAVIHDYNEAICFYGRRTEETKNPVTQVDRITVKAAAFAARKHAKGLRKGIFVSAYMNHVAGVFRAEVVEGFTSLKGYNRLTIRAKTEILWIHVVKVLVVPLLHDTLEDTSATESELEIIFGSDVSSWVGEVTDPRNLTASKDKKANQELKALTQSMVAVFTKLSDRLNNLRDGFRALPEILAWTKLTFTFDSSRILVANFNKNFADNVGTLQDWEKAVFNNLMGHVQKIFVNQADSLKPKYYFYIS